MKSKSIVLSVLLVTMGVINANAQGVHLGIKAGANIFKINGDAYSQDFQYGYNVGAFLQLNLPAGWGIQPELMFNQTNYKTGNNFSDLYSGGPDNFKGKLSYLTVPVLLSFRPIPFLSLQAGPQFGILLNQDEHLVDNTKDAFKKGDLSLVGGAQLNLGSLLVGARYVIGLNNINDVDEEHSWKNQGWQAYVGFRIF